mmetsp:Transcript_24788/g.50294  ORF Transcript_24788/g.50294 Transcript_24788/m.50294 type:complete len:309 (-) Transcript_24788:2908-3834(-)
MGSVTRTTSGGERRSGSTEPPAESEMESRGERLLAGEVACTDTCSVTSELVSTFTPAAHPAGNSMEAFGEESSPRIPRGLAGPRAYSGARSTTCGEAARAGWASREMRCREWLVMTVCAGSPLANVLASLMPTACQACSASFTTACTVEWERVACTEEALLQLRGAQTAATAAAITSMALRAQAREISCTAAAPASERASCTEAAAVGGAKCAGCLEMSLAVPRASQTYPAVRCVFWSERERESIRKALISIASRRGSDPLTSRASVSSAKVLSSLFVSVLSFLFSCSCTRGCHDESSADCTSSRRPD